ncbi:MAG: RidA family protein [Bacteroidales bacterium]|nr:RidA family protein [Bacteroidales bacterium]
MKIIKTTNAPAAVGTYSQAIMVNGFLFASGQLGINPATGELEPDFKTQAAQVMKNVKGVLEEAGLSFSNVVKTTVFLSDISNFAALNEVYAQYFSEPYPARSAVAVKDLPKGGLVEMEVIAVAE